MVLLILLLHLVKKVVVKDNELQVNKDDVQVPGVKEDEKPLVGIQLNPRKPEPTPSTKRALEVMAQKPPVEKR